MTDELAGPYEEDKELKRMTLEWIALIFAASIFFLICLLVLTSGCVTMAKNIANPPPEPTPIPTPTPSPTPTPEPTPEPTLDYTQCGPGCYPMREWITYFREDANNFGEDLRTSITVYGYQFLPSYHIRSYSWGSHATMRESPPDGKQFLFIFLNMYSDGDDARQYGFQARNFAIQIADRLYYPDDPVMPESSIMELEDTWDYAHVHAVQPWGYQRIQDKGTGIMRVEEKNILYSGRSNAWDGYLRFTVPYNITAKDVKVAASLNNLGGHVWWQLK